MFSSGTLSSWILWSFSSVQFSHSVMSDSLRPREPRDARPPYPSPTLGVYPNSCPLSQWCHLTITSSVVPFSSCLESFPTSGSFQMSQLFVSGGQNAEDINKWEEKNFHWFHPMIFTREMFSSYSDRSITSMFQLWDYYCPVLFSWEVS